MQQDITFTMEIDGAPCQCTVLFTFYSDITKAHYMLYTPDDPAGPALGGLLRQGRVHGGQRRAHGGG